MKDHNHEQSHSHSHAHGNPAGNKKALTWVLALSSIYLVAEIVGGVVSGSLALIADAGHMALDVAAIALGLFAAWIAQRPPSPEKTYGYYRAEILAALLNGATLVVVSLWIFYEAWQRFSEPAHVQGGLMALVAAGGLVVNLVGLYLLQHGRGDNLNMRGVWLHVLTDMLGSVAALLAGFLVWRFDWQIADPIISVIIAGLILFGSWKLLWECFDVLMVAVPRGIDYKKIREDILSFPTVIELHDLHVWAVSNQVNALSVHLQIKDGTDHAKALEEITQVLREKHRIDHVTLQLEPSDFVHRRVHYCAPGKAFHSHAPDAH